MNIHIHDVARRAADRAVVLAVVLAACGTAAAPATTTPAPEQPKLPGEAVYDLPGDRGNTGSVIAFCDGGTRVYARDYDGDRVTVVPSSPECGARR